MRRKLCLRFISVFVPVYWDGGRFAIAQDIERSTLSEVRTPEELVKNPDLSKCVKSPPRSYKAKNKTEVISVIFNLSISPMKCKNCSIF